MSTDTERDALARLIHAVDVVDEYRPAPEGSDSRCYIEYADTILSSSWLAEHDREVEQRFIERLRKAKNRLTYAHPSREISRDLEGLIWAVQGGDRG